jgi:hypothetical protein
MARDLPFIYVRQVRGIVLNTRPRLLPAGTWGKLADLKEPPPGPANQKSEGDKSKVYAPVLTLEFHILLAELAPSSKSHPDRQLKKNKDRDRWDPRGSRYVQKPRDVGNRPEKVLEARSGVFRFVLRVPNEASRPDWTAASSRK